MTSPTSPLPGEPDRDAATAVALGGEVVGALDPLDPLQMVESLARTVRPDAVMRAGGRVMAGLAQVLIGRSDVEIPKRDVRFRDPTWSDNGLFRRLAQGYLLWAGEMMKLVENDEVDWRTRERSRFLMTVLTSFPAPSNNPLSNPEVLKRVLETGGSSVLDGLGNLLRDLADNGGLPAQVRMSAFELGKDLAASPGAVVHRTEMFEILQYSPTTETVRDTPLLLLPPPVNKYYFWDLAPGRSMIEYVVGRGLTVFTMVWRDPKPGHGGWGIEDYVRAQVEAVDVARDIAGTSEVHVFGDCSGGLFASLLLGYEAATGGGRLRSATLGVTVLDMGQPSGVGMTASDRALRGVRQRAAKGEVISAADITSTFVWMRPDDLVWRYVINNWMLGKEPPAFDVLYWNSDGQGLPSQLALDLTRISLDNSLTRPGALSVLGVPIDLSMVKADVYAIAGKTDHISPWKACYATTQMLGGTTEFVLTPTGHVQSIIYPPTNPKASFWTGAEPVHDPDTWLARATRNQGSWWPHWVDWLIERSGAERPARSELGNARHLAGEPAPGRYVRGE